MMFGKVVSLILVVVSASLIFLLIFRFMPNISDSFSGSICKFSAFIRAQTVGLPVIQQAVSVTSFFNGGTISSALSLPLACNGFSPLESNPSLSVVVKKIADSSARCWDIFGFGLWDPLVFIPGQSFKCYGQRLTITCTVDDLNNLFGGTININGDVFNQELLDYYMDTHYYSYAGLKKTYSQIVPRGTPIIGSEYGEGGILCDGLPHTYIISLYFVDSFMYLRNTNPSISCAVITPSDLNSDKLYLCIMRVNDNEV